MSRYLKLIFALFVMTFSTPALAALPNTDAPAAEAKTSDVKAEEAKAGDETGTETGGVAKTDGETETGGDAKAETKEIKTDEEAVEAAGDLYNALTDRNWSLAVALALALLVWLLRKVNVLKKVPAAAVPWVSAGLAAAGYVVAALMVDGASLLTALLEGAAAGAAAVGLWEMLLKHLLGSNSKS